MSAAHSAPAGIATGSPRRRQTPALLAQHNAAARAFRSRSSGLVVGAVNIVSVRGEALHRALPYSRLYWDIADLSCLHG